MAYTILSHTAHVTEHNSLVLRSKVDLLDIKSVYTIDNLGNKIELIASPIQFNGLFNSIGVTYKAIKSDTIYIDADVGLGIVVADVLYVNLSDNKYKSMGSYRSTTYEVDAGEFIQPIVKIENTSDIFVDCSLDIKLYDRHNNIRQQDIVPLLVNDDGKLAFISSLNDTSFLLPLEVTSVSDVAIYLEDRVKVPETAFSLGTDNKEVIFDSRNLDSFTVIYTPKLYKDSGFTQINTNLFMNKNNLLRHNMKDVTRVEYIYTINMINLDFRTINETPVIKTLGLVTY